VAAIGRRLPGSVQVRQVFERLRESVRGGIEDRREVVAKGCGKGSLWRCGKEAGSRQRSRRVGRAGLRRH